MYVYLHTYTCYHHASPKAKNKPLLHRQEKIALPWRSYRWICPTWVLLCARWASRRSCPREVPVLTPRNRRRELWKKKGRGTRMYIFIYIYIYKYTCVPGSGSPLTPLAIVMAKAHQPPLPPVEWVGYVGRGGVHPTSNQQQCNW